MSFDFSSHQFAKTDTAPILTIAWDINTIFYEGIQMSFKCLQFLVNSVLAAFMQTWVNRLRQQFN